MGVVVVIDSSLYESVVRGKVFYALNRLHHFDTRWNTERGLAFFLDGFEGRLKGYFPNGAFQLGSVLLNLLVYELGYTTYRASCSEDVTTSLPYLATGEHGELTSASCHRFEWGGVKTQLFYPIILAKGVLTAGMRFNKLKRVVLRLKQTGGLA